MLNDSVELDIPFQDIDMFSIGWHGNYPAYLESARCKLLEKIEFDYIDMQKHGLVFPIVDMRIKYLKPLVFGQKIRVTAVLHSWEGLIKINYCIEEPCSGEVHARGWTKQAALELESMKMLWEIPEILERKISVALESCGQS